MSPEQLDVLLGKLGGGLNIFLGRDKSASVVAEARQALAAREGLAMSATAGSESAALGRSWACAVATLRGLGRLSRDDPLHARC